MHKIKNYYDDLYGNKNKNKNKSKIIAVDGTYNNKNYKEMLNIGIFDVSENIPIDIKCYGAEGKNKEIESFKSYVLNNLNSFQGKNHTLIFDSGYYSYSFINFLNNNKITYIIRVRGKAKYLNKDIKIPKSFPNYDNIIHIRNNIRIIKYNEIMDKIVYSNKNKDKQIEYNIKMENNCILVTNLEESEDYTNDKILNLYKLRWDIEVYFKYLKNNFKFQHINEKQDENYKKMYICELIISYIALRPCGKIIGKILFTQT